MRYVLILLVMGMTVWIGLGQCAKSSRSTLVLKPAASFPEAKKQLLGQTVARVLPYCPGFQKLGAVLEFTDLLEEGQAIRLSFMAPDNEAIPAEWAARGRACSMLVEEQMFHLGDQAGCQALCLGEAGRPGQAVSKSLTEKVAR